MNQNTFSHKEITLNGDFSEKVSKLFLRFGFFGLILSTLLFFTDKKQFFFSYLTVFCFFLTLSLGSMFIVLILHLTRAGWGVVVRRISEHFMCNVGYMAILFIPLAFGVHDLYHWTHADEVAIDHLLQIKSPFLNIPFFYLRTILYFGSWIWLARRFFKYSILQDKKADSNITLKLQKSAAYSILIYGLTQSFAFIDWVMSITPHWYSTIFGVYFFAGSAMVAFVVLSLTLMYLRKNGFLANIVSVEHFHDLGKLSYGFMIFWSYIAFSQFFLIWYANIPEETLFYQQHFNGTWNHVSLLLCIGHFAIPFLGFMSRHIKRNLTLHAIMASWLVFMHYVDMFWIIMPNITPEGFSFKLVDLTIFIGIGGVYFSLFFSRLKKYYLVPVNDPRLSESISFKNH